MLKDPSFVCGYMLGMPSFIVYSEAAGISEGLHRIAGYEVEVIATPGHTFGAVSYVFRSENMMFCGDAVLHYAKVPLNRPSSNAEALWQTMQRLLETDLPDSMMVYCGHRESVTLDEMRRESPDMIEYKQIKETRMTDFEAIQNLVVSERIYRVSHRDEELAKCYADDAHIHTSWQSGGRESFVGKTSLETGEVLPNVNRCNPPLIHFARVNGNPDRAVAEYPMTTTRSLRVNGEEAVLASYMLLIHRVERRGGEWKIVDMYTINEYDTLTPAVPGTDLHIRPEEVARLRKSYRWLAYTRQQAGGTISPDLVGTDRPEGVKEIYDAAFKWLNE